MNFVFRLAPISLALMAVATAQETLPLTERAYIAGRVYSAAMQYFAHWQDVPALDPDAAYRTYVDRALVANDRRSFARATLEFLASFKNSHTTLIDQVLMKTHGALPFDVTYASGEWVVTDSGIGGLDRGDIVKSIDGQPFEMFYVGVRPFIPASTEAWARRALFARMGAMSPYAYLLPDRFVLRLASGRELSIDRGAAKPIPPPQTEGRWLEPGTLAYIRIPSFSAPQYEKRALELLTQFRSAPALIVDVRGNTGGSTPGEFTSRLMDRPYRFWTESTPVSLPYFRFRAGQGSWELQPFGRPELLWRNGPNQPAKEPFTGRLALLVDAACHSACEDFVMPFKDNGRALIVGEQTAGSTGQPYMFEPYTGMMILIGAKRAMFADGAQFESVGIRPDVAAAPSASDIRAGRDAVLDTARTSLAARREGR